MIAEPISVIAIHGVALSENVIEEAASLIQTHIDFPEIHWIFPRAELVPVTLLNGREALAWYDIRARNRVDMDESGIEAATDKIEDLVNAERRRTSDARRIVLMGFSQGGCLALHAGLTRPTYVEGIVALATALPFPDRVPRAGPFSPPLLLGHGVLDPQVSFFLGRDSWRHLRSRGYDAEWHSYALGHTMGQRQLQDVSRWLNDRFLRPRTSPASFAAGRQIMGQDITFKGALHETQRRPLD